MGYNQTYVVEPYSRNQRFISDPTTKQHFDDKVITVLGQTGEVFLGIDGDEDKICWFEVEEFDMYWSEKCIFGYDNTPGVMVNPDWCGYSGYEDGIYHRYSKPSEHCFRILQILGYKELGQQTSKDREAKLKFERLKKENKELRAKFALLCKEQGKNEADL